MQVSTQQYRQQYRHSRWPQEVGRRRCLLREGPMCFRETLSEGIPAQEDFKRTFLLQIEVPLDLSLDEQPQ